MSKLNFFANPWASGTIRGVQVASRLGADVNPTFVSSDDICICVKSFFYDEMVAKIKHIYVDTVDSYACTPWLREHPSVDVIAISRLAAVFYQENLSCRDVRFIREHHCNFERKRKQLSKIKTVGYIGEDENFTLKFAMVKDAMSFLGVDFVRCNSFASREEVCNFYQNIDVQLTYRKDTNDYGEATAILKNPLKLANAGSFGVPTIAYPEATYIDEWKDCFMEATNIDAITYWVDRLLRDDDLYHRQSDIAFEKAEHYHIDNVIPLYQQLIDDINGEKTVNQIVNGEITMHKVYPFEDRIKRRGTEHMDTAVSMRNLLDVIDVCKKLNLSTWLMYGTLLGMVRDKSLIPYDRDTDLGVFELDVDKLMSVIKELQRIGFELIRTEPSVATVMRNDEYLDFYLFRDCGGFYSCEERGIYTKIDKSHLSRLPSYTVNGSTFSVPSHCYKLFEEWYGVDWNTPIEDKWALKDKEPNYV